MEMRFLKSRVRLRRKNGTVYRKNVPKWHIKNDRMFYDQKFSTKPHKTLANPGESRYNFSETFRW